MKANTAKYKEEKHESVRKESKDIILNKLKKEKLINCF